MVSSIGVYEGGRVNPRMAEKLDGHPPSALVVAVVVGAVVSLWYAMRMIPCVALSWL